nr:hybrid sensor histidine kinase/response regulator transcription factor [uncultured Arsenicibacter sp.]
MVSSIVQDRKGFIWITTKDGLNRYDGYNFKVFTPDIYNEYSISDANCMALLIDRHDRLWVGTLNHGLNLLDVKTGKFYHLNILDQHAGKSGDYEIHWISEDPEGHLWVNTNKNQLFQITLPPALRSGYPATPNFTGQVRIRQFALPDADFDEWVNYAHFRPDGQATLGSSFGRYRLNWRKPDGETPFSRISRIGPFDSTGDNAVGEYWFTATLTALHAWYKGKHTIIPFADGLKLPGKVLVISPQKVAVLSRSLLWIMSPDELFRQKRLDAANAFSRLDLPQANFIRSATVDQNGLIWVGTLGYGLLTFNTNVKNFRAFLPHQSLSYLLQDQQKRIYARQEFNFGEISFSANHFINLINPPFSLPAKLRHYIIQDSGGHFRVLAEGKSFRECELHEYTRDWKLQKRVPLPAGVRAAAFVGTYAIEDTYKQLWFGMADGKILRFDPVSEQFRTYSYAHLLPQGGTNTDTYFLYVDQAGILWICTNKGLIRTDNPFQQPRFSLYRNNKADRNSLSHEVVSCVVDDPNEPARYLWVSTKGGGLNKLDKATGRFTHLTEADGLPNKVVYSILTDEFKNLWMSTNRGLSCYNPGRNVFHNYSKSDGLQDDEFNTASFLKLPSGELLFGGVNGLTVFRPADIVGKLTRSPEARIIGLSVNSTPVKPGDGVLQQEIEYTQSLDLNHDQNILTLEFSLTDYLNPAKNRYRYRLLGADNRWIDAGTNRFANYTHLPDGTYTFQMTGSADGEVWSKPVILGIRIHPPLYRTWWAYLCYLTGISIVIWQIIRIRTQRLLLEQQVRFEQQEAGRLAGLDALKTRFFTNISHEFRTPLTLMLGPLSNRRMQPPGEAELSMMERNGRRLLTLINQLLDLSKLEAGNMRVDTGVFDVAAFFRTLASACQSLADSKSIRFVVNQRPASFVAGADRDKLEKIVTNLLSNAFKFTPAGGEVRLEVICQTSRLEVTVSDTGIGIPAAHLPRIFDRFYQSDNGGSGNPDRSYEGTGIGLALVHELVTVQKGTVSVRSTEGEGTTFRVVLPLIPANFPDGIVDQAEARASVLPMPDLLPPTAAPADPVNPSTEKMLLIIDDNADIRAFLRTLFAAEYVIIEAEDGQQGLEKATEVTPDLVICDLMMPRLDGFGFCRQMKTQEATSHIPVIMLTARATTEDRIEGYGLGADDYLTKPFDAAEIRARVRNLIRQRERLRQYFQVLQQVIPEPVSEQLIATENNFLKRLQAIVQARLSDSAFDVEELSRELSLSPRQLVRKIKALTGETVVEYIRNRRLERAEGLIRQGKLSIAEIAYEVGFENTSYFSRIFQERFGELPSTYAGQQGRPL